MQNEKSSYLLLAVFVNIQMQARAVVDIIVNSPDQTTLETALIAAGLADDLSGADPFTVFTPSDAAFVT